jgi:hypothetical protein
VGKRNAYEYLAVSTTYTAEQQKTVLRIVNMLFIFQTNKHSNDEMEKNEGACRSHKKYGTVID